MFLALRGLLGSGHSHTCVLVVSSPLTNPAIAYNYQILHVVLLF